MMLMVYSSPANPALLLVTDTPLMNHPPYAHPHGLRSLTPVWTPQQAHGQACLVQALPFLPPVTGSGWTDSQSGPSELIGFSSQTSGTVRKESTFPLGGTEDATRAHLPGSEDGLKESRTEESPTDTL